MLYFQRFDEIRGCHARKPNQMKDLVLEIKAGKKKRMSWYRRYKNYYPKERSEGARKEKEQRLKGTKTSIAL